jgi:NTE family protein
MPAHPKQAALRSDRPQNQRMRSLVAFAVITGVCAWPWALLAAQPAIPNPATTPANNPASSAAPIASASGPTARPKVGLVLGGGGARGAAHVGVLEVLERLRIPVDCVAGTSMGALVAGAWAAGLSPAQMREELAKADWDAMFQDNPEFPDLNFRSKRLSQRFLAGSETGITADGAVAPPGVVSGQRIKLFFNQLVRSDAGERELQQLPLPVSIIATDIGTGERVVYRDGPLTQAMRASMSVPGLMSPLEYRGRKLVDGGLVDNLPIREVRERCGAQVVIAVNVGSPPLAPAQVTGLLSITTQMVALLTEQNVSTSVASLKPTDIYIKPDLGDITAAAFDRNAEAADKGRAAAETWAVPLAELSVDAHSYALWQTQIAVRQRTVPRIDEIEIAGLQRVNPEVLRRYVEQQRGQALDIAALNRDLLRAYGDGHYERVDYTVLRPRGRNVLRLMPVEKSWGPDYLRLALQLDSNLSQGATFRLRAGYQKTWLNRLGAELLMTGELGSSTGAGIEFYQPLDDAQRFFVDTSARYVRDRTDFFRLDQRVAEYRTARTQAELSAGINFNLLGQLRLGWRESSVSNTLETGTDVLQALPQRLGGGWLLALDTDQFDRLYFPRAGWGATASYFGAEKSAYSKVALDARGAWSWQSFVLGTRASWTGSPRGQLPITDAGKLGGFLNLTGFAKGQLIGDEVAYAHVRAERIIGSAPLGLRGDMRLGLAIEAGKVAQPYTLQKNVGWLNSVAVYLGGETPLGPAFLGVGLGTGGSVNAYLVIGAP